MSDTPRTDAAVFHLDTFEDTDEGFVNPYFARQLERELTVAVRERDEEKNLRVNEVLQARAEGQIAIRERGEARAECERLREDAERYRWLRRVHEHWDVLMRESEDACWQDVWGDRLDAAIDKARGKT